MIIATVVTGCLMLKSESSMTQSSAVGRLAVLQARARIAQYRVSFGETTVHGILAGALIMCAQIECHLLQRAVLEAPGEGVIALVQDRGGRYRKPV
jgi:hypothetical protein